MLESEQAYIVKTYQTVNSHFRNEMQWALYVFLPPPPHLLLVFFSFSHSSDRLLG